jgi:hypothetical protein
MSRPIPLKKLLGFLTKKAPKLAGTIVEGGLDLATGGVFGDIKDAILGSDELSPEDKQLALAELNNGHEAYLAELKDRQDARAMNVAALQSKDQFIRRFPAYLASGLVLLITAIIIALIFVEIPQSNQSVLYVLMGVIGGMVTSIGAFYYGSSSGSKEKSGQLSQLLSSINK